MRVGVGDIYFIKVFIYVETVTGILQHCYSADMQCIEKKWTFLDIREKRLFFIVMYTLLMIVSHTFGVSVISKILSCQMYPLVKIWQF